MTQSKSQWQIRQEKKNPDFAPRRLVASDPEHPEKSFPCLALWRDPNPSGICQCGCGEIVRPALKNYYYRGLLKGFHTRFNERHSVRMQPSNFLGDDRYAVDERGCWVWQGARTGAGYGLVERQGQQVTVHRYFYEKLVGPIPPGHQLHHKCHNKVCVNPDHLEVLTPKEHRRTIPGRILTPDDVREIRVLAAKPGAIPYGVISEIYGIPSVQIGNIAARRTWGWVNDFKEEEIMAMG